jgi:hypothetical protein
MRTDLINSIPKNADRWLYEILHSLAQNSESAAKGFAAIVRGEVPDGSGISLFNDALFFKLGGRPGGQIGYGDTLSAGSLTLSSSSHATKGLIYLGSAHASAYDEVNDRLGIGTAAPSSKIHVHLALPGTTTVGAIGSLWFNTSTVVSAVNTDISSWATYQNNASAYDLAVLCGGLATSRGIVFTNYTLLTGFRLAFGTYGAGTVNFAHLQAGLLNSDGTTKNRNILFCGFNDHAGQIEEHHFDLVSFLSLGAGAAGVVRVGIGHDVTSNTGTTAGTQPTFITRAWPAVGVQYDKAFVAITGLAYPSSEGTAARIPFFDLRDSTDLSGNSLFSIDRWGRLLIRNPGNGSISSCIDGNFYAYRVSDGQDSSSARQMLALTYQYRWTDNQFGICCHIGDVYTTLGRKIMIESGNRSSLTTGIPFDRLGISSLGTIICDAASTATGSFAAPLALLHLKSTVNNATVLFAMQRKSGQTGDFTQWLDSDGTTKLTYVDKDGNWKFNGLGASGVATVEVVSVDNDSTDGTIVLRPHGTGTRTSINFNRTNDTDGKGYASIQAHGPYETVPATHLSIYTSAAVNGGYQKRLDISADVALANAEWVNLNIFSISCNTFELITAETQLTLPSDGALSFRPYGGGSPIHCLAKDTSNNLSVGGTGIANVFLLNSTGGNEFRVADGYIRIYNEFRTYGGIRQFGSTSGSLIFQVPATITSHTIIFPATQGAASTYLGNDGSGNLSWEPIPSGFPPGITAAKYIVQEVSDDLSAEQSLGLLTTGIIKNTVTGAVGVLSIAVGTDLPNHTHAAGQGANIPVANITGGMSLTTAQDFTGVKTFKGDPVATFLIVHDNEANSDVYFDILGSSVSAAIHFPSPNGYEQFLVAVRGIPARGDLIMATTASPYWERLAKGSVGKALIMGADEPAWTTIGSLALVNSPCPIANGGTGQTTLAAAGIPQVVAVADLTLSTSTGLVTWYANAPVGTYRVTIYHRVTTAGAVGDYLIAYIRGYHGGAERQQTMRSGKTVQDYFDGIVIYGTNFDLQYLNATDTATILLYHDNAAQPIRYNFGVVKTGTPVTNLRAQLEYLGP